MTLLTKNIFALHSSYIFSILTKNCNAEVWHLFLWLFYMDILLSRFKVKKAIPANDWKIIV